jgi:hypothetical protein
MIDWEKLNWQLITTHGLTAISKRDIVSFVQVAVTFIGEFLSQMAQPVIEEPMDIDFIRSLQESTPIEVRQIRFTSEGGWSEI